MNSLLIFFAFPIAVIIISAVLQKTIGNPIAISALVFAVFLVITFAFFDETFLIETFVYTIISFLTAFIIKIIFSFNHNSDNNEGENEEYGCENCVNSLNSRILNNNTTSYRYKRYRRN